MDTMNRRAALAGLLACLLATPAAAQWRWPWDFGRRRRSGRRKGTPKQKSQPIDCDAIRKAVTTMKPEQLEKALRRSNKKQRDTIARCMDQ